MRRVGADGGGCCAAAGCRCSGGWPAGSREAARCAAAWLAASGAATGCVAGPSSAARGCPPAAASARRFLLALGTLPPLPALPPGGATGCPPRAGAEASWPKISKAPTSSRTLMLSVAIGAGCVAAAAIGGGGDQRAVARPHVRRRYSRSLEHGAQRMARQRRSWAQGDTLVGSGVAALSAGPAGAQAEAQSCWGCDQMWSGGIYGAGDREAGQTPGGRSAALWPMRRMEGPTLAGQPVLQSPCWSIHSLSAQRLPNWKPAPVRRRWL